LSSFNLFKFSEFVFLFVRLYSSSQTFYSCRQTLLKNQNA